MDTKIYLFQEIPHYQNCSNEIEISRTKVYFLMHDEYNLRFRKKLWSLVCTMTRHSYFKKCIETIKLLVIEQNWIL